MLLTELMNKSPGDFILECEDGRTLKAHKVFLSVASTVFNGAFADTEDTTMSMKVKGDQNSWSAVLEMLYPVYPRPELTLARIACMLHILHMYDFNSFLQESLTYLSKNLPDNLSPDPASPCFVMTWLKLADNLQLSELQELCMQKLRVFAHGKLIEGALLAPCKHAPVRMPRVPKPASCPNGHSGHNGQFSFGGPATHSYCPSWCNSCKAWVCCSNSLPGPNTSSSRQMFAASSAYGAESVTSCQVCGRGVHHEPPSEEVRWFSDDQPELADGIKTLSRQALEELLAGVIAATCGSFSTGVRPHNQKQGITKTK